MTDKLPKEVYNRMDSLSPDSSLTAVAKLINNLQIEGFDDYEIKLFLFQKAEEQK
jgi:hypothetical protein